MSASLAGRRVLVSAGPTFEDIDPVRFLGNRSSGRMGFALAAAAVSLGAGVFPTFSVCGHTAAHRARQAVIAAVTMILFFILFPPLWM